MAIGLDDDNVAVFTPMIYDLLLRKVDEAVLEELIAWTTKNFQEGEDELMNEIGKGCRRWLSQAK